ncbi:MAG: lamin tail domain-containing protein [Verrucomicrobia bacterium]|nr:lamin tail domain-containing protein [Verrucomicrobiota bacterium]
MKKLAPLLSLLAVLSAVALRADTVVVFNEIMYHPATNEPAMEWLELRNQMAVDVDISGWSLAGAADYIFPSNSIVRGGGLVLVACSNSALPALTGLTNIFGPFASRLGNNGDHLVLRNNSGRVMDEITYGVDGDWPVPPDGSGVSLAKLDREAASGPARNWTWSDQLGGTPGTDNFPFSNGAPPDTRLLALESAWRFHDAGTDLGTAWRETAFDDNAWSARPSFTNLAITTLFNTGVNSNKTVLAAGNTDPHYLLTAGAQGTVGTGAVVQLNHPNWLANDTASSWIGVVNNGSTGVNEGNYSYRTTFSLDGFIPSAVRLNVVVAADNSVSSVLLNGASTGISFVGFGAWSGTTVLSSGFVAGTNTLEFLTVNDPATPNPHGFRALLSGSGLSANPNAPMTAGRTTYYFRQSFLFAGNPAYTALKLNTLLTDGAVFYLNGVEVHRQNMPGGPVDFTTPALTDVAAPTYSGLVPISAGSLIEGANVLAVEVHQAAGGLEGALLGVELFATPLPEPKLALAFTEFSATTNAEFWLELVNAGGTTVALDGLVIYHDATNNHEYVFPPGSGWLAAGAYLAITNSTLGFTPVSGDKLFLLSSNRAIVLDGVVAKRAPRARYGDSTGPWLRPNVSTPGSWNTFAFRDEIVINEIMYSHARLWSGATNPVSAESAEEWIELFNRSTNTVDLTGWELDGGIQFQFPTNQTLAPGAYLVVAKDATALRSNYPSIDIVGNYSGRLSGRSDLLVLKDAVGNPANQVRYYDDGHWPAYANGGGSSLELRDPLADNSKAEAWAASDESGKSSWQTFSYRMTATIPSGSGQPTTWNDFIFGLLGGGECLIDDLSVVQSPGGGPVQVIANGNFESGLGGWRSIGNHGRSRVETEPGNPGNHVLHVIASGPQEHMHNHIEATLANGRTIVSGTEYQISFRVKWLAGNNLLNTRLYFNRVARSTVLPRPALNGTPGTPNSRLVANLGPTFRDFQHLPVVPQPGEPVLVSVGARDPQGVLTGELFWSVNGGAWQSVGMENEDGGYYASIPPQAAGAIVQFYVRGVDRLGAVAMYPPAGPDSGALYMVADGQANLALGHNLRIILSPANRDLLHALTNVMSNDNLPATVVYDERRAYYDVGVRLKGSERGRYSDTRTSFHIEFQPDDLFRGVHPVMLLDRSGAGDSTANKQLEIVIKHMLQHAGNIPGLYSDLCRVIAPRSAHTGASILSPRHEDEFIETAYQNGGSGTEWELELIYYPTTANAFGYKLPQPDSVVGTDLANLGDDKEIYRYNFIIKNHRDADDYAPFIPFAKALSLTGTALDTATRQTMDVNEWLRSWALVTLCGVGDSYTFGNNHNLLMYLRPSDGKMLAFPVDMDFSFNRANNAALIGDQNLSKVINLPANLRRFYAHILDIINTTYNTNYMARWPDHYDNFCPGQDFTSSLAYIQARANFARTTIAGAGGSAAFALTSPATVNLATSNQVVISGTAPVQVQAIAVNGVLYPVTWSTLSAWSLRVAAEELTNRFSLVGYDLNGLPLTNYSLAVTVNFTGALDAPQGTLVINEAMFNPAVSNASFVELYNRSSNTTFNLTGCRLQGIDYDFPGGTLIGPRSFIVLAKDAAAYTTAYGVATNVALFDQFPGILKTNAEKLTLLRLGATPGQDVVIDRVHFENVAPWLASASRPGSGVSFQCIDPAQDNSRVSNWGDPVGWRFFSFTGQPGGGKLFMYLDSAGDIYLDDFWLTPGTVAEAGTNLARNGDFESTPLSSAWLVTPARPYAAQSTISTQFAHSGSGSLHLVFTNTGSTLAYLYQDFTNSVSTNIVYTNIHTMSFWYLPTTNATNLTVRMGSTFRPVINVRPRDSTPGLANNVAATLPPYPLLWLNEIQPNNPDGLLDNTGLAQPWIELFNSDTNAMLLDGFFLTSTYSNLNEWAFPTGTVIGPGEFKVLFADGRPETSSGTNLHTSFRLDPTNGSVALVLDGRILDYLNYTAVPARLSAGSWPDGQVTDRQLFYFPTPGASNNPAAPPVPVAINEWMASNTGYTNNPVDAATDDWIELHNYGTNTVDLGGCYLTDNVTNQFQFMIPTNGQYVIPPGGYLLVWADNNSRYNATNREDLHVSFQLNRAGEQIGLFTADGDLIDAVTFGAQNNNISEGRYPDAGPAFASMPVPTPKGPNQIPATSNSAPVLAEIPNQHVTLGQTLRFTASATDAEQPLQTLAFTLDPGAPAGAQIDGPSGQFSWTPTLLEAPGTAQITVRVTDNGVPPLSATRLVNITVWLPPRVTVASPASGELQLGFGTVPGKTYRIDFKTNLTDAAWSLFQEGIAGDGTVKTFSATTANIPQRFYRIVQLD